MTDILGPMTLPVTAWQTPVGDPLREKLGAFLQSAINLACSTAWRDLSGGTGEAVVRVETNDPSDNTFVATCLPCLAIYRHERARRPIQLSSELEYRESKIVALWIPPAVPQFHRGLRESFYQAIEGAVRAAIVRGRTPGWIDDGDTDAIAATEGSLLAERLGLLRPLIYGMESQDWTLEIAMAQGDPQRFPSLMLMFEVWEQLELGMTYYPSALSLEMTNAADEQLGTIEDVPS